MAGRGTRMGMVVVVDLLVGALSATYAFIKEVGRDIRGLRDRVKTARVVTVFVVTVVISTVLMVAGHVIQLPMWLVGETKADLGGLDLAAYCSSYGFDRTTDKGCESDIKLGNACDWSHDVNGSHIKFTSPDSPLSGICYGADGRKLGGISDMDGYCHSRFKFIVTVRSASQKPHAWRCETSVDPSLACNWQYQKLNTSAQRNDADHWRCYEKKHI